MWMKNGCQSTSENINEKSGGKTWMMMELKAKETRLFWTGMGSQKRGNENWGNHEGVL